MSSENLTPNVDLDCDRLPLILVGPILRRTEPEAVTVWLTLKAPRRVTLRVYGTHNNGEEIDRVLLKGDRATVPLGQHLHLVAVTATPLGSDRLQSGQIYAYDLNFGDSEAESLADGLSSPDTDPANISYFGHRLPTFALPPQDLNDLRLVHGSCRKPHGGGRDALPLVDRAIATSADRPNQRPHQLLLTGDQIYGDDVADLFCWLAGGVGDRLLGWEEPLPVGDRFVTRRELTPGTRSEIAEQWAGFTAMLYDKPEKAKSHLFGLGEYCAAYLLAWSPVLWPDPLPSAEPGCPDAQQWDSERQELESFVQDLDQVRRALANVPTYTIFDDHDISDDWCLNRQWCDRVLGQPLGRRAVQNGMLAYALFQAWGNTPEQFNPGQLGEKLLQATERWSATQGRDETLWQDIGQYLGMPPIDPDTGQPQFQRDGDVLILQRSDRVLDWHYTIRSHNYEILLTDTRTWRGYPAEDEAHAPPMLLCPTAFEAQLQRPLDRAEDSEIEVTLIVLPTNLVSLGIIDRVHQWELKRGRTFGSDVGDAWNLHSGAFIQLLKTLHQRRDRVVILSGDIHYSCAVRLTFYARAVGEGGTLLPVRGMVLAQLTSSAIKNAEWMTYAIHTKVKSLFPERSESWLGWDEPLQKIAVPHRRSFPQHPQPVVGEPPDWSYQIEWIDRQQSQPLPWGDRPMKRNPSSFWRRLLEILLSWLWRSRWLQEGKEVVGRNNISVVSFHWPPEDDRKATLQETYWHPAWHPTQTVKSRYIVPLRKE